MVILKKTKIATAVTANKVEAAKKQRVRKEKQTGKQSPAKKKVTQNVKPVAPKVKKNSPKLTKNVATLQAKAQSPKLKTPKVKKADTSPIKQEKPEDGITLDKSMIEKAVKKFFTQERESRKGELFDENNAIFLQLNAGKIPKCKIHTLRLSLQNSVLPPDPDILLVTSDFKKNPTQYEKNIEHYKKLLEKHEITCVKDIIPLHKFRSQYKEYEMQNKLAGLYDLIIVDSSVQSYFLKTVGAVITKRNKLCWGLKLQKSNLKGAMGKLLIASRMTIHGKGDSFTMHLGHTGMKESQVVDNIIAAGKELTQKFPGGFQNIKGLFIKTARGKAVQFYASQINFGRMKTPIVVDKKTKRHKSVQDELSTLMDAKVTVKPGGDVYVHKSRKSIKQEGVGKKTRV